MTTASDTPDLHTSNDRDDAARIIRRELKRRSGKTWSVTGGRGTSQGWLLISAPPARRVRKTGNPAWHLEHECAGFHVDCGEIPAHLDGAPDTSGQMSTADLAELCSLLDLDNTGAHWQGVSVPDSREHRIEYVDRARGLAASPAQSYWD